MPKIDIKKKYTSRLYHCFVENPDGSTFTTLAWKQSLKCMKSMSLLFCQKLNDPNQPLSGKNGDVTLRSLRTLKSLR